MRFHRFEFAFKYVSIQQIKGRIPGETLAYRQRLQALKLKAGKCKGDKGNKLP